MANEIYHRSNWGNAVNDKYWADVYEKYSATNKMYIRSDYYENSNETDKLMADIYPKPSILLTPTAYDNGSLHSVKPVKTFGSELVTNGTFDTDSDWSVGVWSIENGVASVDGQSGILSQLNPPLQQNKLYKWTFEITEYNGGSVKFYSGSGSDQSTYRNSVGVHTEYFVANGTGRYFYSNGFDGSIDNVSLKEVTEADFDFSRGSSATRVNEKGLIEDVQILSGNLVQNGDFEEIGSEEVTNGDFATDSDWILENGAVINNGSVNIIGVGSRFRQDVLTVGKLYKLQYEVISTNGELFRFQDGITAFSDINQTIGSHTYYFKATGVRVQFQAVGDVDARIDNVSVKEVGQNWNLTSGAFFTENGIKLTHTPTAGVLSTTYALLTTGRKYRMTYEITENNDGGIKLNSATVNTLVSTVGVHTKEFISDASILSIARTDPSANDVTIDNISVQEITDDTDLPRINYTNGEGSLLLEPQSTNLFLYSQDFTNSYWSHNADITVTNSSELAPNGKLDAHLIEYDGSGYSFIRVQIGVPSTAVTLSVFAKKGNWRYLGFRNFQIAGHEHTVFDFDTETFSNINAGQNASFEIFPNGWYRIKVTQPSPEASHFVGFALTNSTGLELNPTGGQVANVHLFGAQVEEQSYATSYIPTNGEVNGVTRLADVCNNSASSDLINSTEGVLYAEISALADDLTSRSISLSNGTYNNSLILQYRNISNTISIKKFTTLLSTFAVPSTTDYIKIAISYNTNIIKIYLNGLLKDTNNTFTSFPSNTLNRLNFDRSDGGEDFYGNVKSVAVFKEALDNDQLERLTGEGYETFNLLAQANNYTII